MIKVNKKLWSFIFGCLIATSFLWLISFGKNAHVLEYFHQHPEFVVDYYALLVTALATVFLTAFIILIMNKVCDIHVREHPFWLILPSFAFTIITMFTSQFMLASILSAAIPALSILVVTAIIDRLANIASVRNSAS